MGGADLGELGEDAGFEVEDLGHGFDDHVDFGQGVHGCCWAEVLAGFVGVGLGELFFGDVFGEELVCRVPLVGLSQDSTVGWSCTSECKTLIDRLLIVVDEGDRDAGCSCCDQCYAQAL